MASFGPVFSIAAFPEPIRGRWVVVEAVDVVVEGSRARKPPNASE